MLQIWGMASSGGIQSIWLKLWLKREVQSLTSLLAVTGMRSYGLCIVFHGDKNPPQAAASMICKWEWLQIEHHVTLHDKICKYLFERQHNDKQLHLSCKMWCWMIVLHLRLAQAKLHVNIFGSAANGLSISCIFYKLSTSFLVFLHLKALLLCFKLAQMIGIACWNL